HTLRLSVVDGALLGLPDSALSGVIDAVEQPRIGEVAVVGYLDVVRGDPHEGADDHFRVEEAGVVSGLDTSDLDAGRGADDAQAIGRCGDRAGGVGAVASRVIVRQQRRRAATGAVCALAGVVVGRDVRVAKVEAGVQVGHRDRRAAAGYRVSRRRIDLAHVPL